MAAPPPLPTDRVGHRPTSLLRLVKGPPMLLRLVLLVTVAALVLGVVVVVALSRRDTAARRQVTGRLEVAEHQLRTARGVLRRIANNTSANPGVDASLALDEMDTLDHRELPR